MCHRDLSQSAWPHSDSFTFQNVIFRVKMPNQASQFSRIRYLATSNVTINYIFGEFLAVILTKQIILRRQLRRQKAVAMILTTFGFLQVKQTAGSHKIRQLIRFRLTLFALVDINPKSHFSHLSSHHNISSFQPLVMGVMSVFVCLLFA